MGRSRSFRKIFGLSLSRCKGRSKRKLFILLFLILIFIAIISVFVIFPLIFQNSIELQRLLMFSNVNLPNKKSYFENYKLDGFRNLYVTVNEYENVTLGVWHLLPLQITNDSINNPNFDYDEALYDSEFDVLLNFHGAGEARSYFIEKTELFRNFFHVINFDYRSYADSTRAVLSEDAVIDDCVNLYLWLKSKTKATIFIWGHSLGAALATRTTATLLQYNIFPKGLFLESGFTSMKDELPLHPVGKYFAWLPWFHSTIIQPLENNGFIFNTSRHIRNTECPIMIMHAENDDVIPFKFAFELFQIAKNERNADWKDVKYYPFPAELDYEHNFIYKDPYLPIYIQKFLHYCHNSTDSDYFEPNS